MSLDGNSGFNNSCKSAVAQGTPRSTEMCRQVKEKTVEVNVNEDKTDFYVFHETLRYTQCVLVNTTECKQTFVVLQKNIADDRASTRARIHKTF